MFVCQWQLLADSADKFGLIEEEQAWKKFAQSFIKDESDAC